MRDPLQCCDGPVVSGDVFPWKECPFSELKKIVQIWLVLLRFKHGSIILTGRTWALYYVEKLEAETYLLDLNKTPKFFLVSKGRSTTWSGQMRLTVISIPSNLKEILGFRAWSFINVGSTEFHKLSGISVSIMNSIYLLGATITRSNWAELQVTLTLLR